MELLTWGERQVDSFGDGRITNKDRSTFF